MGLATPTTIPLVHEGWRMRTRVARASDAVGGGRLLEQQVPHGKEGGEGEGVDEDVEEPLARDEGESLAHRAVGDLEQPRGALLEQRGQCGELSLESSQWRALGEKVGREAVDERHEDRERGGLLVIGHHERDGRREVHRL